MGLGGEPLDRVDDGGVAGGERIENHLGEEHGIVVRGLAALGERGLQLARHVRAD